jgi:hypothetical protein
MIIVGSWPPIDVANMQLFASTLSLIQNHECTMYFVFASLDFSWKHENFVTIANYCKLLFTMIFTFLTTIALYE